MGMGTPNSQKSTPPTKAHVDLRLLHCEIRRFNALIPIPVPCLKSFSGFGTSQRHLLLALREGRGEIGCAVSSGQEHSDTKGTLDAGDSFGARAFHALTWVSYRSV
jgi:hypothetical protein